MLSKIPSVLSISGMLSLACCATLASAEAANVTWISPSDGDNYASGDTLVGRWSSDKAVVSPSFRMCVTDHGSQVSSRGNSGDDEEDGEDNDDRGDDHGSAGGGGGSDNDDDDDNNGDGSCGATMWPTVEHSDGSYFVHMFQHVYELRSLPNVTSSAHCYLLMVDNFGVKMSSPTFSFGDTPAAGEASPTDDTPTTPPASASDPSATSTPSSAVNAGMQNPAATPQPPAILDESRMPVPTAAYAVPLSLVASVIVAAGGLSVHQRRKLRTERLQEQETLKRRGALSRHSTLSLGGFLKLGARTGSSTSAAAEEESESFRRGHRRQGALVARATSVSMMRAWRRGVSETSRDERRQDSFHGSHASTSDDATLRDGGYIGDGGRGGGKYGGHGGGQGGGGYGPEDGFTSIPLRNEPRRPTREPYHASHSRARRTTVPASLFRAVSPVFPSGPDGDGDGDVGGGREDRYRRKEGRYHDERDGDVVDDEDDEEGEAGWDTLTHKRQHQRKGRTLVDPGVSVVAVAAHLNASVNDSVVERYLHASPVPPPHSPSPASPPSVSVSRPDRLHVRRYAEADRGESSRRVPSAEARDADRELYDAVARSISRGSNV
ncbi:hypothetical protein C8Q78DRAFT_1109179 [Trametes maxima]|nr:hypothetical protein C8Q78DRAFT_1109179 [Trametes maxima]